MQPTLKRDAETHRIAGFWRTWVEYNQELLMIFCFFDEVLYNSLQQFRHTYLYVILTQYFRLIVHLLIFIYHEIIHWLIRVNNAPHLI